MPTTKVQVSPLACILKVQDFNGYYEMSPTTAPPVYTKPGEPPVYAEASMAFVTKSITSTSTPNWAVPKPRYVSIPKARKPFRLKPPVQPVYRPSRQPAPPIRRVGSSDASWQRIMRKHNARLVVWDQREFKRRSDFERLQALFNLRMSKYNLALAAYRASPLGISKKRAVGKIVYSVNNPFTKVFTVDTGWDYNYRYRQYGTTVSYPWYPYWLGGNGPGPRIVREIGVYGRWPDAMGYLIKDHPHPSLPSRLSASDLVNTATHKCINQLFEKLSDQQVHIGNMVAERAQTYEMFGAAVSRLRDFLHSPKRTVLNYLGSGAKGLSKKVSDDFLQYAFGVEPLLSDVHGLAEALAKSLNDTAKSDMVKVHAGGSANDSFEYTVDGAFYVDTFKVSVDVKVRYMCEYRIDNSVFRNLGALGLVNPAEIAWEVMPWSFVIDWFLPIGKFMSSLTAEQGLSFRTGTMSVQTIHTRSVVRRYKPFAPYEELGREYVGEISRTLTEDTKNREVLTSPPVSRLPMFKSPFSPRHFALSLALWRQQIR